MQLSLLWKDSTIVPVGGWGRSTPAMEGERAYLASELGHVICVALSNGEVLWQFRASSVIDADLLLVNDYVIVTCNNGFVYALDKSDGTKIWMCLTSGPISHAPSEQDGLLYVGTRARNNRTQGGELCCIDSRDGSLLWTYHVNKPIVGSPAVSGDHLVFCGYSHSRGGNEIYCVSTVSRQLIWRQKTQSWLRSSPVITSIDNEPDEKVFVGVWIDMWCMDLATGRVDWSSHGHGEIGTKPCVCRLGVVFGNTVGKKVYSLDRRSGDLQWVASTDGLVHSPILVADSHVLATSDDNHLYCFEARLGECEWKREFTPYNITRMNVLDNYLLLTSRYKDVYCFKIIADEPRA